MAGFLGQEIPPRRCEYLRYILERGGQVKSVDLAGHFQVDPSTITKAVHQLSSSGYVVHTRYRGITLSEKGREYAEFLLRRHRILGLVLCHHGLSHEEACQQALQMEGSLPRTCVDKMCASLGHPTRGICGEIPRDEACCSRNMPSAGREG